MTDTDTHPPYSLADLARMRAEEAERVQVASFKALTATAVADATGNASPDISQWLRSDDVCHDWHDALLCAIGGLQVSAECLQYLKDPRGKAVRQKAGAVKHVLETEAVPLLRKLRGREEEREKEDYGVWDAVKLSNKLLGKHFPDERDRLEAEERQRRGLRTRKPPIDGDHLEGRADLIESLYWHGILHTPVSAEIQGLRDMRFVVFREEVVVADCREQEERNGYLRHPLVLARWKEALDDLAAMTSEFALDHSGGHLLTKLPQTFSRVYTHNQAMRILNARRFLSAVKQRQTEARRCWRQLHAYTHEPLLAHREPWRDANRTALLRLAQAHPEEYAWLRGWMRAVLQDGQEGDTILRSIPSRVRGELRRNLAQGLADGTWRNSPPPTP